MAQIVILNSINAASGKTLLAAHLAVMLAKDYKAAVLDSAGENSALAMFTAKRYHLNLGKNLKLPIAPYFSLASADFENLKASYDVLILDNPPDKFFKLADIFITPLCGDEGLKAVTESQSLYAALLWEARKQRAASGKNSFKWFIVPNDEYSAEQYGQLAGSKKLLGYALTAPLRRRPEYANGIHEGITVLDKDLPALKTLFDLPDLYARRELKKLAEFIWQNK